MDLNTFRREYLSGGLRRQHLASNPFDQFNEWMQQAVSSQIADPTAMTLATVDPNGQPDQRIVLLKHASPEGLVFYTNYSSQKAQHLAHNPKVCLHFPWHMIDRQVRIQGVAEKLTQARSLQYFLSRPRDSQLAAWASPQSRAISSRQFLLAQFQAIKTKFLEGDIPLPDFWGGYCVVPHRFEFWQGGGQRLHDRFNYQRQANGEWTIERLAP